jgi:heme-degrading monooxygenase HmoA
VIVRMTEVASFHLATFPYRRMVSRMLAVPAERWEMTQTAGCRLGKVMGTSKTDTTRISFELRRWAVFAIWENEDAHRMFMENSSVLRRWRGSATTLRHYLLEPIASRGTWNGEEPFPSVSGLGVSGTNTAVLTRAAVRPTRWWRFAHSAGAVDDALRAADDCTFAVGIGEWPIGEQATFSVWRSAEAINAFAYHDDAHSDVIRRTFKENWYSEMLFTRFAISSFWDER